MSATLLKPRLLAPIIVAALFSAGIATASSVLVAVCEITFLAIMGGSVVAAITARGPVRIYWAAFAAFACLWMFMRTHFPFDSLDSASNSEYWMFQTGRYVTWLHRNSVDRANTYRLLFQVIALAVGFVAADASSALYAYFAHRSEKKFEQYK